MCRFHTNGNGNGYTPNGHGRHSRASNGNGSTHGKRWNCTDGQRGLVLRLISQHNLEKQEAGGMAREIFGTAGPGTQQDAPPTSLTNG